MNFTKTMKNIQVQPKDLLHKSKLNLNIEKLLQKEVKERKNMAFITLQLREFPVLWNQKMVKWIIKMQEEIQLNFTMKSVSKK